MRYGRIDPLGYYADHEHRVVYVENAKCACTAIKQALFPQLDYAALGQEEFHRQARASSAHSSPPGCEGYLHFTFVRDPAERLASCHADKIAGGESIFAARTQRLIFGLFAGVDPMATGDDPVGFARAISAIPDRLRDRHIAAQAPVLRAVRGARNTFVGRVENLTRDWEELQQRTGLPDLKRLNTSSSRERRGDTARELEFAARQVYRLDYELLGFGGADAG